MSGDINQVGQDWKGGKKGGKGKGKWKGKDKGKKGKGKEKGKYEGKGTGPLCYWCRRPGHQIADCWDLQMMKGSKGGNWYNDSGKKGWNWNQPWSGWQGKGPNYGGKVNQVNSESSGTSWGALMISCGDDDGPGEHTGL